MPKEVKSEVVSEDMKKQIESELVEKSKKQQEAALQINKILADNDLRLVIEQNIKIMPNQ